MPSEMELDFSKCHNIRISGNKIYYSERDRAIRLLREALVEIDAGLTMSAKAGIMNAIEYLEAVD